jgi:hypothetical protein
MEEGEGEEEKKKLRTTASSQKIVGLNGTPTPLTVICISFSSAPMPE